MFKRDKKEKQVESVPNPPKVLKELKNYRFVLTQVPLAFWQDGKPTAHEDLLILEVRDTNTMAEPYWKVETELRMQDFGFYPNAGKHNLLVSIVKEFLGLE